MNAHFSSAMPPLLLQQHVDDESLYTKASAGKGNGVFAKQDTPARAQVMLVARPLIATLETLQLHETCYTCLRNTGDLAGSPNSERKSNLKTCSGCKVVKFCDKECQTRAWSQYHQFECKIY